MIKLRYLLTFFALAVVLSGYAQSDEKIDKKLSKLYQKGKITKCEKKALKFKKKNPKAASSYYYLSKIEIYASKQIINPPNKKQYKHIKKAATYSKKAYNEHPEWFAEVKDIYSSYINSWPESEANAEHLKTAIRNYEKFYSNSVDYNPAPNTKSTPVPEHETPTLSISLKRKKIIESAEKLVGIPYKYAGTSPKTGFDCSGFTQYLYKQIGIELPHSSHMQSQVEGETLTLEEALPGDLIIFGRGNTKKWKTQHTGIIYENKDGIIKVIHSASRGVCIDGDNPSWESYWKERVLFVKRVPALN